MNKHFRLTKQRKIIFEAVISRCDHPTADDIYLDIHSRFPNISKSTVYRNLDILEKEGKINHVIIPGSDRFDLTPENHYHVLCKMCGKVVDVSIPYSTDADKKVENETGFAIEKHNLFFEGICPECQNKLKQNKR